MASVPYKSLFHISEVIIYIIDDVCIRCSIWSESHTVPGYLVSLVSLRFRIAIRVSFRIGIETVTTLRDGRLVRETLH